MKVLSLLFMVYFWLVKLKGDKVVEKCQQLPTRAEGASGFLLRV